MKAITTKYIGATNFKGSRFVATTEGGNRITIPYDYSLNAEDNHKRVALALCDKMKWSKDIIGGGTDKGYVWVFNTPNTKITELKDKLKDREKQIALMAKDITDKANQVSRRNMQIKDLKDKRDLILTAEDINDLTKYKEVTICHSSGNVRISLIV